MTDQFPITMRESLSPNAQVVLDALDEQFYELNSQHMAAAVTALRAAANQIRYENEIGLTAFAGHVQAQDQILAIAAELEESNG